MTRNKRMSNSSLKLLQITCATIWCLFSSGIIFGFAAFKTILVKDGVCSDYCLSNLTQHNDVCIEQDLKLNDMFVISVAITNLIAFPVGFILDKKGPRVCGIIGSILLALGSTFFIMARQWYPIIDCYILGYVFLAMGGPFVFISCFQLANSFPKRSGAILGLLTGCFNTSSVLFWLYKIIYQMVIIGLSLKNFFIIYMAIPAFILFCQCTFMPQKTYKNTGAVAKLTEEGLDKNGQLSEGDDGWNITSSNLERMSLLNKNEIQRHSCNYKTNSTGTNSFSRSKSILETYVENKLKRKSGGVFGILHEKDMWTQLRSP
ncbi:Fmp42p PWA37_001104 [Arxiozyma heterogenica]|uniref:Fmp42p n=1 Tax=Arxiozyma heterogenica TaxID=278026 RepID=UPI002F164E6A